MMMIPRINIENFQSRCLVARQFRLKVIPVVSEQLILDVLPSIVASTGKPEDVIVIKPKFIRWGEQGKYWEEEWKVESNNGSRDFSLTLTPTPDGGADYKVTPKKEGMNNAI